MEEFEVKGPEESLVEKHVEHEGNHFGFASKVALLTALLSTLGAFYSYNAGKTLSDAMMLKNESGISKTEAANQWAFYQAKSTKQAVFEGVLMGGNPTPDTKDKLDGLVSRYNQEKEEIQNKAKEFEESSKQKNEASEQMLHRHHKWSQATTAIQIAISLAAITILTRKKWLFFSALGVSLVSIFLGIISFIA